MLSTDVTKCFLEVEEKAAESLQRHTCVPQSKANVPIGLALSEAALLKEKETKDSHTVHFEYHPTVSESHYTWKLVY